MRPIIEHGHDEGCSVTGGYVYRGRNVPALQGRYPFSDYCSGTIWSADAGTGSDVRRESGLGTALSGVTSFGEDADGELYVIGNGAVHRFEPEPTAS